MTAIQHISAKGLAVWIVCTFFFLYECLLRTSLGTFQPVLMSDLQLNSVSFALLSSTAYNLMFGPMQIPIGFITERFGLKYTLLFVVSLCSIACTAFALAPNYQMAFLARMFMGIGSSFGFLCLLVAIYDWIPKRNIAFFIGLSQFIATLGPMLSAGPLVSFSESASISWREVFLFITIAGVIIAALVFLVLTNNKQSNEKNIILNLPSRASNSFRQVVREPQIWYIAIFSACVFFTLEYLSENESKTFLMQKGFSKHFASYMVTAGWLGYAFGCAILGYISDRMRRRKTLLVVCAFSNILAITGIVYFPLGEALTSVCFILLGVGASGQSIGFAIIAEHCMEKSRTLGLGLNNTMIVLFNAALPPLIGIMLSQKSPGLSTLVTYKYAFLVMVFLAVIAVIFSCFYIKETFCKSMRENTPLSHPKYLLKH